ncbi:MAG: hypothetical protein HC874_32120 [Richelia sp. SL_2_1]|nr:hypothetical protein [Richelia sp. SL_2_1]
MSYDYWAWIVTGPIGSDSDDTYEPPTAEEIAEEYEIESELTVPETPDVWEEYDGQQAYE